MLKPRPPLAPAEGVMAPIRAERSCEKCGRAEQSAKAGPATMVTRAPIEHESTRRWMFIVLLLWSDGWWDDKGRKRRSHRACAKSDEMRCYSRGIRPRMNSGRRQREYRDHFQEGRKHRQTLDKCRYRHDEACI